MALSILNSLVEAGRHMKQNICHYRTSFAVFILFIFFLSLFGHSFQMVILINFVFGCFLAYRYDPTQTQSCPLTAALSIASQWERRICIRMAAIRSLIKIASWSRSLTLGIIPEPLLLLLQTPTNNLIKRQRVDVVDVGNPTTTTATASNVAD
ncbi:hypothetical protein FEM48_Zijuj02G0024700 [Ziziphus jujuba var. spinosa]|uniref:PRA1 family protein n=1 Tax=Ziziphus jujuba var. spinosa TaxID=714518 RepID=A0A978VT34_ZIZJJ|nr:hypothetical protein FEM48_Zijuj02G0024700 [Ziziphus jujuba var. spinosa]